jgi:hypothetical protein
LRCTAFLLVSQLQAGETADAGEFGNVQRVANELAHADRKRHRVPRG